MKNGSRAKPVCKVHKKTPPPKKARGAYTLYGLTRYENNISEQPRAAITRDLPDRICMHPELDSPYDLDLRY